MPGRKLRGARVTASRAYRVGTVVCVHARDMKEPWCPAASDAEAPAGTLIKQYARRWTIEPSFRETDRCAPGALWVVPFNQSGDA